jgi:acetyl-CoA C-acetyltransferase
MTDAYIYDAIRTPRGKGRKDGALHEVTSLRLSALTLNALKERNNLRRPRGRGRDLGQRHPGDGTGRLPGALGGAGLGSRRIDPGLAINRFCASGHGGGEPGRQPGPRRARVTPISPAGSR